MEHSHKRILSGEEARAALALGINEVADAVGFALGPTGSFDCHRHQDGTQIAESVQMDDRFAQIGVKIAQKLARSLKEEQGDGSTTGLLLLKALTAAPKKQKPFSPLAVQKGFEAGLPHIFNALEQMSLPVKEETSLFHVTNTIASNDPTSAAFVTACLSQIGSHDLLFIEEHSRPSTKISSYGAASIETSLASCLPPPSFPLERQEPFVFLSAKPLLFPLPILPLLQHAREENRPLLFLAPDFGEDVLSTLAFHSFRGSFVAEALRIHSNREELEPLIEDLALLTGAAVSFIEHPWEEFSPEALGFIKRARIGKKNLDLLYKPKKRAVQSHVKRSSSSSRRIAFFSGKGALLTVGAASEEERKAKRKTIESALQAAQSSVKHGAVIGGGAALFHAAHCLSQIPWPKELQPGIFLLQKACEVPLRQIIANGGYETGRILEEISSQGFPFGLNGLTASVENLIETGLLDPLAIVKNTLFQAVEAAKEVWNAETIIAS